MENWALSICHPYIERDQLFIVGYFVLQSVYEMILSQCYVPSYGIPTESF